MKKTYFVMIANTYFTGFKKDSANNVDYVCRTRNINKAKVFTLAKAMQIADNIYGSVKEC